jgi:hypothetical protein
MVGYMLKVLELEKTTQIQIQNGRRSGGGNKKKRHTSARHRLCMSRFETRQSAENELGNHKGGKRQK